MRRQIRQLLVLLSVLLVPLSARAQQSDPAPLVLQLPASTRALGLGNAFLIGSEDPGALFYNPALISPTEGISGAVQRYGSAGTLLTLAGATEWEWATGGVALGVQALSYGAPSDNPDQLTTEAALLRTGPVDVSELVASAGYARSVADFELGIAGKWIEQRVDGERDATAALDLGASTEVRGLIFGLAVQNLGPALETGGAERELPLSATLGATLPSRPMGPLDVAATAAITTIREGELAAGGRGRGRVLAHPGPHLCRPHRAAAHGGRRRRAAHPGRWLLGGRSGDRVRLSAVRRRRYAPHRHRLAVRGYGVSAGTLARVHAGSSAENPRSSTTTVPAGVRSKSSRTVRRPDRSSCGFCSLKSSSGSE